MALVVILVVALVVVAVVVRAGAGDRAGKHSPTIQDMINGVDAVKITLLERLVDQYEDSLAREDAYRWAAAVVNYVFFSRRTGTSTSSFWSETATRWFGVLTESRPNSPTRARRSHGPSG